MSWEFSVKAAAYYGVPHSRTREDDRREYWFEFLNRDFDFFVLGGIEDAAVLRTRNDAEDEVEMIHAKSGRYRGVVEGVFV